MRRLIEDYLENIHNLAINDPLMFAAWVLIIMAVEGAILGLFAELIFKVLGIEVEEIAHH